MSRRRLRGRSSGHAWPVALGEFHSPKVRAGREKLDAHAGAPVGSVSEVDDSALLLLFRHRIGEHELGSQFEGFLKIEQGAMGIDHNGLAGFAEAAPLVVLALGADSDPGEDSGTAPLGLNVDLAHGTHHRAMRVVGSQRRGWGCVFKEAESKSVGGLSSRTVR
jgi:hypothetical protein